MHEMKRGTVIQRDSIDMRLRGRIGGYSRAAKYNPEQLTGDARRGFFRRFMPEDPTLSEEEKQHRAQAALNAHMAQLARKSAIARSKRRNK
jgi:hypothetical protein